MSDEVVILERTRANFDTGDENVLEPTSLDFGLDGSDDNIEVFLSWYVEAGIPLAVDVVERNECAGGRHLDNDCSGLFYAYVILLCLGLYYCVSVYIIVSQVILMCPVSFLL